MNKKILRLAVPNILSNLSVPLLSSVDTAVVGHLDKVSYLGAVAIGSMIFNFIYWGFGFLRMGTTGLTAQADGEQDKEKVILLLSRALFVALAAAVVLILFQSVISKISFALVHATSDVELYAKGYFDIRIYAAPATLGLYAFIGWFLGLQNVKYPLILALLGNSFNIIFDLLFIYVFGMKSDGVALGTVVAQYLGLIVAVWLFKRRYSEYLPKLDFKKIFDLTPIKEFFKVNADIFIRTLCLIFTFSYFTAKSAEFGDNILAANTILLQLWMILSYGVDGFAFAAESLVGNAIGAKDKTALRNVVKYSFYWGMGMGAALSAVYFFFGKEMLAIYTNKPVVIDLALGYFVYTIFAPVVNSVCFIWDGIFIGATATKAMRNSMLFCTLLIFLPVYYFTKAPLGNHSLWIAMTAFMIMRGLTLSLYSKKSVFGKISFS